jgi:hypothetical protein
MVRQRTNAAVSPGRRAALAQGGVAVLAGLVGLTGHWPAAVAQPATAQPTVLTLKGRLRRPGQDGQAHFDMPALATLPQHSFTTRTPWFAQPRQFSGPLLRDVLAVAGAQGDTLRLTALNDYSVDMPFDDPQRYDVLLARLLDGKPMAVRDKGPLFAIYPFDHAAGLHNVVFYSRSAWQLRTIEVL